MSDKIAEIRARHEEGIRAGADADRAYLLAQVERLTRERDEARAEVENLYDQIHRWVDDRAKAQSQADRLREQNYELQRERDEARAAAEELRSNVQAIAALAHAGADGTYGLSEHEALVEIRCRSLSAWDRKISSARIKP